MVGTLQFACALLIVLLSPAYCLRSHLSLLEDPVPVVQDVRMGEHFFSPGYFGTVIDTSPGVKPGELLSCIRVRVLGVARLGYLNKYAHSFRAKVEIPIQGRAQKVDVCFHGNASLELCQCTKESWKSLEKGIWIGIMSPFETRFLDLRIPGYISEVPLQITLDEEFWPFRLMFLGVGLFLLLVAPLVSNWVPFYYSSGMTLGVLLIILVLLFQCMKLLPTGRKSTLYIFLYGSLVGMGTVILHYFTGLVSSILKEIGISDKSYNSVAVFLVVGLVLIGAWLGYWGVRKLVLSEDGTVDIGTAQFVKWALRIFGGVMILQSSHDPLLAVLALLLGIILAWMVAKVHVDDLLDLVGTISMLCSWFLSLDWGCLWTKKLKPDSYSSFSKAEFLSKDDAKLLRSPVGSVFQTPPMSRNSAALSDVESREYLSSFHKSPTRRYISRAEYTSLTQKCTKKAMQELTASPKFASWFADNADRVLVLPTEHREDRSTEEIERTARIGQAGERTNTSGFFKFGFR